MTNNGKTIKTEEEWKKIMTPDQYRVMRGKGTERPFSSELLHADKTGDYYCAACGNLLRRHQVRFRYRLAQL